jgi:hypothetical protein
MKTWITKYGYPETRTEVEHDKDECPACKWTSGLDENSVCYVEVEKTDGTRTIRRVMGTGKVKGFFARLPYVIGWTADEQNTVECKLISREDVERELAEAKANGWLHEDPS